MIPLLPSASSADIDEISPDCGALRRKFKILKESGEREKLDSLRKEFIDRLKELRNSKNNGQKPSPLADMLMEGIPKNV